MSVKHESALGSVKAAAAAPANIAGRWRNELGSWTDFHVSAVGLLSGHYHSAVGLNGGPVDSDDLTGYVQGDLVSFMVRWPDAAITSWVGRHKVDEATGDASIETLWQMTLMNSDGVGGFWHSILAGADHFSR